MEFTIGKNVANPTLSDLVYPCHKRSTLKSPMISYNGNLLRTFCANPTLTDLDRLSHQIQIAIHPYDKLQWALL